MRRSNSKITMKRPPKSKITIVGAVQGNKEEGFSVYLPGTPIGLTPIPTRYDPDSDEPIKVDIVYHKYWVLRRKLIHVEGYRDLDEGDLIVLVKHEVLKRERTFERIRMEVEAFENLERLPTARREPISEAVRLFVWQRDGGKCVVCGRRDRLEFDHIIPVTEGGGNTERNLQLLCETCNRQKGKRI